VSLRIGLALLAAALLIRGYVCFRDVGQYEADPDAYGAIARTLAQSGVFGLTASTGETIPTAFRPPLYPYVLSWLVRDGTLSQHAVALFHTLLGCMTVLCSYAAAGRLLGPTAGHRASILAGLLVIVDPVLLYQSGQLMTETLAAALASAVVWWWARPLESLPGMVAAMVLGVLLALAVLCRPTFIVWAVVLVVATALDPRRDTAGRIARLGHAAVVLAVLATAVGGWAYRNARVMGHPVWATTHGGYTLLLANNPLFYDYLRVGQAGSTWDAEPFLVAYSHRYEADPRTDAFWRRPWRDTATITARETEWDDDRLTYEAATATIERQPAMFAWSCFVRAAWLWSPLPHRTAERTSTATIAIGLYCTLLYGAVLWGAWKLGRRLLRPAWWPSLTLALTLTLVHAVYWSNLRMRAPAIPSLALVAAAAVIRREQSAP
jgi:hypothetical protein